jgi:hypothetical protein
MRKEIIALRVKPVAQERTKEELKQYHEEIKIKKQQILRYYGRRIKDLDRMVDNFGVVDGTAALWQTGEVAGKVVVASLTVEMLLHTLTDIVEKTGAVDYVADSIWGGDVKAVPEAAPAVTPTPESAPVPVSTVTPETIPTTPAPIEATPAPSTSPVEDFTKDHLLYKETDAEITSVANGIKVEYQIGGEKGDFATLDQALRRVVAQEIDIGKGNELDATEATRAENVLANLRQLLEGKAVGVIKPAELDGIAQFKDGKLTILNYQKFDDFMDGKLFKRAIDNITEANIDTGYAQTSTEKWQEMLDKRGEKATIDFGSSTDAKASEVVESAASGATPTASPEAPSVATPVENLVSTEKNIDSNVIAETLGQQVLEPMDGGRPAVDLASRPLQEVTVNTASYPAEYMSDILSKMSPDQASALAEVMIEAKIDEKEWEGVNFIIEGNTDLLRNADGKFDPNQIELALELSKVQYPKPAELRLALEAMKVLNLEETQEAAIVKAITNPKEGPKALKDLFGDSIGNRGAKVTLNPRKGILHFENLGPQKLDGNMNFREGVLRIGKRAGAIFGGKFPLKNLVQAINSFK